MNSRTPNAMTSLRFEHEVRSLERELLFQREVAQSLIERHAAAVLASAGLLHSKLSRAVQLWSETCRALCEEADTRRRELLSSLSAHEERLARVLREVDNDRHLEASWGKQKMMMEVAEEFRNAARERQLQLAELRATENTMQHRREMTSAIDALDASWETLAKAMEQLESRVDALDKREALLAARERAAAQRSVGTILRRGRDVMQCLVCDGHPWTVDKVGRHRIVCFQGSALNVSLTLPRCDLELFHVTCSAEFDGPVPDVVLHGPRTTLEGECAESYASEGARQSPRRYENDHRGPRSLSPPNDDSSSSAQAILCFRRLRTSSSGSVATTGERESVPSKLRCPELAKVLFVCTPRAQPLDYVDFEVLPSVYEMDVVLLRRPAIHAADRCLDAAVSSTPLGSLRDASDRTVGVSVIQEEACRAVISLVVDVVDAPDPFFVRRYLLQRVAAQKDDGDDIQSMQRPANLRSSKCISLDIVTSTTRYHYHHGSPTTDSTVVATRLQFRSSQGADTEDILGVDASPPHPSTTWNLLVEVAGVNEPLLVGSVAGVCAPIPADVVEAASELSRQQQCTSLSEEQVELGFAPQNSDPETQEHPCVDAAVALSSSPPTASSSSAVGVVAASARAADSVIDEGDGWRMLYNAVHRTVVYWHCKSGIVRYGWSDDKDGSVPSDAAFPSVPHPRDVDFPSQTQVLHMPPVVGPLCLWAPREADMLCLVAVTVLPKPHTEHDDAPQQPNREEAPHEQLVVVVSIDEQEVVFSTVLPPLKSVTTTDIRPMASPQSEFSESITRILVPDDGSPFVVLTTSTARVFRLMLGATWSLVALHVPEENAARYLRRLSGKKTEGGTEECYAYLECNGDAIWSMVVGTRTDDGSSAMSLQIPLVPCSAS